jgi:hypothetical protein
MIGVGRFGEIDAKAKTDIDPGPATDFWKARVKTKGSLYSTPLDPQRPWGV